MLGPLATAVDLRHQPVAKRWRALLLFLSTHPHVERLSLVDVGLENHHVAQLTSALPFRHSLARVDVSCNNLTDPAVLEHLRLRLRAPRVLVTGYNKLSSVKTCAFCRALPPSGASTKRTRCKGTQSTTPPNSPRRGYAAPWASTTLFYTLRFADSHRPHTKSFFVRLKDGKQTLVRFTPEEVLSHATRFFTPERRLTALGQSVLSFLESRLQREDASSTPGAPSFERYWRLLRSNLALPFSFRLVGSVSCARDTFRDLDVWLVDRWRPFERDCDLHRMYRTVLRQS